MLAHTHTHKSAAYGPFYFSAQGSLLMSSINRRTHGHTNIQTYTHMEEHITFQTYTHTEEHITFVDVVVGRVGF